jgi:hypothetical protein
LVAVLNPFMSFPPIGGGTDPATGVGGLSFSSLVGSSFYISTSNPATDDTGGTATFTVNGGSVAFLYGVPSGYVAWDVSTIWDAGSKHATTILTNTNKTAELAFTGPQDSSVRTNTAGSAGLRYFEITVNDLPPTPNSTSLGIVPTSTWTNLSRVTSIGIGYDPTGTVRLSPGGSVLHSMSSYTNGDTICVAVDVPNKDIWLRKNGGTWNG